MGLRPLACWDCGFESRQGHGCLYVVSVVCCQVEVSATGLIIRPEESYRLCCVVVCDLETSRVRRLWPTGSCCARRKRNIFKYFEQVTGRQGRRRRKLLDDLKERRGYSHLKEEALDRTRWRARFGRGFGPVVRQTTKWMNVAYYVYIVRSQQILK